MQPRMSTTESISSDKPISIGDHIEYVGKDETTAQLLFINHVVLLVMEVNL